MNKTPHIENIVFTVESKFTSLGACFDDSNLSALAQHSDSEAMGIAELRMAMARRAAMASELGDGVRPARRSRAAQVSQPKLWLRILTVVCTC